MRKNLNRPAVWRVAAVLAVAAAAAACQPILNTLTPSGGYGVAHDVLFEPTERLRLDVYRPVEARNAPVVVFFYGGRWSRGVRQDFRYVGEALASEGFVALIPDVRPYPKAKLAGFLQDAARAVAWAEQRASKYGGDPAKLFVMGHSSGAHLAAMLALDPAPLKAAGADRARLRGMIGLAGAYDFLPLVATDLRDMFGPPEQFELSQPISFVDGDNPPMLLLHGEDDDTIPVRNTESLAARLRHHGGPVETVIYPRLGHTWIIASLSSTLRGRTDVLEQVADFIRRKSNEPLRPPVVETSPRR